MSKITIPWDDGSGDNLYLDLTSILSTSETIVTSDKNLTGFDRKKTLIFKGESGNTAESDRNGAYLTIIQRTDSSIVASFEGIVSMYSGVKATFKGKLL